jgi:glycosyltransferase involved in cell wall biosynthesis
MQKSIHASSQSLRSTLRGLAGRLLGSPRAPQSPPAAPAAPASIKPLIDDPATGNEAVRLLIFADGPGATQTISFVMPLAKARASGRLRLRMVSEADFESMTPAQADDLAETVMADFAPTHVIVSRFGGGGAAGIAAACRRRALPYVMHLDDNLFAVPEALGASKFKKYNDPARLGRLRLLCERASVIYASTAELARQLGAMNFTPPVVAGNIYCSPPATPAAYTPPETPVIGYMGTAGHAADLDMIVPAITRVLEQHPQARFETFGSIKMPKALAAKFGDRVQARPAAASYLEFIALFQAMNWTCGLAPLEDTPFNACKANTKFIEYTVAGMPCIASDTVVYRRSLADGRGLLAQTQEDWFSAMDTLIRDPSKAAQMLETAQSALETNWSLEALRVQLESICNLPRDLHLQAATAG